VGTVAGVGLLGTLGAALSAAVAEIPDRTAAVVTFVVAASGFTLAGIGPAFWALVAGLIVHAVLRLPVPSRRVSG
jgi:benzoate membrane transport protein